MPDALKLKVEWEPRDGLGKGYKGHIRYIGGSGFIVSDRIWPLGML